MSQLRSRSLARLARNKSDPQWKYHVYTVTPKALNIWVGAFPRNGLMWLRPKYTVLSWLCYLQKFSSISRDAYVRLLLLTTNVWTLLCCSTMHSSKLKFSSVRPTLTNLAISVRSVHLSMRR